jgi:hypothetical protein
VKALKRDVTKVVQAITSKKRVSSEEQKNKMDSFTTSESNVVSDRYDEDKRMSRQDSVDTTITEDEREDSAAYNPLSGLRENKLLPLLRK